MPAPAETAPPEPPRSVSVWVCTDKTHEDRQCFALVEDTRDSRIAHRAWHAAQHTDREALRASIKARDEEIAGYRRQLADFARIVAGYEQTVQGLHGEVQRVETPTAPPALEISRETYDDEQPDEPPVPAWARYEPEEAPEAAQPISEPETAASSRYVSDDDDDETDALSTGRWSA